ncbi:hypothetical protein F5Y06DRAFT_246429 [Hypoxylon sp. FL0890]|nr:hypothetical protein F5Y06DRAFT_246429 [Hypoxylon sp. FL0890]
MLLHPHIFLFFFFLSRLQVGSLLPGYLYFYSPIRSFLPLPLAWFLKALMPSWLWFASKLAKGSVIGKLES